MIPKIIHYVWFGTKQPSERCKPCIDSWKKYCGDEYEIKCWGNDCVEKFYNENAFFRKYYDMENYAFCADFVRFYALYHEGGIYLDCDVEIKGNFNRILDLKRFIGLEYIYCTGENGKSPYIINHSNIDIGVMAAEPNDPYIKKVLEIFDDPECYTKEDIIGPDVANKALLSNFEYKIVNSIPEAKEYESDTQVALFNKPHFDKSPDFHKSKNINPDYAICEHKYFNSWIAKFRKQQRQNKKTVKVKPIIKNPINIFENFPIV